LAKDEYGQLACRAMLEMLALKYSSRVADQLSFNSRAFDLARNLPVILRDYFRSLARFYDEGTANLTLLKT
jgi:hypothetical protein